MTEAQTRSVQITEVDKEEGTFTGLFAPYNEVVEYAGKKERYERGLFDGADLVELYYNHGKAALGGDMPIGEVLRYVDTEKGLEVDGRFYDTPRGTEAYGLTKRGALNSLSANFIPTQVRDEDGVTVWEKAHLDEVSLVKKPAYPSALISQVRSEAATSNATNLTKEVVDESTTTRNMTDETTYDDSEIRSKIEVVERELAVVRDGGVTNAVVGSQYRSGGEFLKALLDSDATAKNEIRAYTGAVLADSHTSNDWKNDLLVIVNNGRPLLNLFDKGPLADHGNNVEFPRVTGTSGTVAVQSAEGDNLSYLEISIGTDTAPVKTYGGYSELSRQVIERSDVSYLDAVLKFQASSYAKVTNTAVKTAIAAATPQAGTSFTLSSATAGDFLGATIDGVAKIDANGQGANADFILVSLDVYAKMAGTGSTGFAFDVNGSGGQTIGTNNVRAIAGSLAGFPIVVDASLAAKSFYVASKQAVTTWENSGAPVRLDNENIINLTKQFSLYGYMAVGVKNALALVKATVD